MASANPATPATPATLEGSTPPPSSPGPEPLGEAEPPEVAPSSSRPGPREKEARKPTPAGPRLDPRVGLALAGAAALVLILLILFWQPAGDFFFQYFSGPVLADARDTEVKGRGGPVTEGYNPYNTLAYGLLFLLGGLAIHRLLAYLKVAVDQRLFLASVPLVMLGGVARALEDTRLFGEPTAYLFIAPIIYFTLAVGGVAVILLGAGLRRLYRSRGPAWALRAALATLLLAWLVYTLGWWATTDQLAHLLHPGLVGLLIGAVAGGGYYAFGTRPLREPTLLFGLAALFALGLALLWAAAFVRAPWNAADPNPLILWQVAGVWTAAMALTLGGLWLLGRLVPRWREGTTPYLAPLSLALFAAHYLDGAATYLGIDYYGYSEKHVLPSLLIETFSTAAVMLPMKAFVVFLVIYLLDVAYKRELEANRSLLMLVKLLILTLGLAPGTRDIARIYLGV